VTIVLTPDHEKRLVAVARHALEARVRGTLPPELDAGEQGGGPHSAFVSIFRAGELRGCLGRLDSSLSLVTLVGQLARAVADSDPRFEPVRPEELDAIGVEISVLSRERELRDPGLIELGRHGLIVDHGGRRGLLLPQVPEEQGWDREAFLTYTCLKAGLDGDAWRRGARLFVFEAHVFGERGGPPGPV
jgi:AmmeMemoRadiSam system protein A